MQIDTSHKSPNHSSREGAPITMLVLHATVGSYASSLFWLTNPASRVSTHYLISKTGHIAQLVPDARAAWHAGVSRWFDLDSGDIQRQSIGIELENANTGRDPYPVVQQAAATELCRMLVVQYAIKRDMVTRHLDIATPRGRKTDPAGLPWPMFRDRLYAAGVWRAKACAPVFQDRRPDAPLALTVGAGQFEMMDDLTGGWLHLESGAGFSPVSCWEIV
jgi:N-acetylmuramoyl-L-alanine amidase